MYSHVYYFDALKLYYRVALKGHQAVKLPENVQENFKSNTIHYAP